MKVLGVCIGHDTSACLVEDGKIVRYVAEERFNRIKVGMSNAFKSVRFCLGENKIEDLDSVVVGSGIVRGVKEHFTALFRNKSSLSVPLFCLREGYHLDNVKEIDHHECHAASSYYTSGFDKALIVTMDGIGDTTTHYVCEGSGAKMKPLYYVKKDGVYLRGKDGVFKVRKFKEDEVFSLGWFYGMVTEGLGWRMSCDEGKTMGLAPYGDPNAIPRSEMLRLMYRNNISGFYLNDGLIHYHFNGSNDFQLMVEKYGKENLAAAAQKLLEDKVLAFIGRWLKRTGHKNLCASGGVFLNVKLNQRIVETFPDVNYWPFPLAGDSGVSIGAALAEYHRHAEYKPERITNLFWGPEYSNEQIEVVLKRNKLEYKPYDCKSVAKALAEDKIVAWFRGRMEGGPRSLGNRSILMSSLKAENKDIINRDVKFREAFRPFCPSVTAEAHGRYFDGGGNFMITACKVKTQDIPAVTHVDGTARPHVVHRDDNPMFHVLLEQFGNLTGHPVLLNTSFNIMGQPIIRTPDDAVRCFYGNGIDLLVIGDFMLEKGRV